MSWRKDRRRSFLACSPCRPNRPRRKSQIGLRSVFTNQGLYIYEPRERTFWPHLTVARVRTADHKTRRPEVVRNLPDRPIPAGLRGPFEGLRVGLYRSEMRPDGARYSLMGKADLPGSTYATLHQGGR